MDTVILPETVRATLAQISAQQEQAKATLDQLAREASLVIQSAAAGAGMVIDPAAQYSYDTKTGVFARVFETPKEA